MDRYSEAFNDIDPETERPFSSGYPDGVWIISIMYSFFILGSLTSVVFGIWGVFFSDASGYMLAVTGIISACMFSITIFFLFKRSVKAITMSAIITMLAIILTIGLLYSKDEIEYYLLIASFLQIYIFIYILGLAKDKLLN